MLKTQSGILAALPASTQAVYGAMPSTAQTLAGGASQIATLAQDLPALQSAYNTLFG
jgi:hypothetical protein